MIRRPELPAYLLAGLLIAAIAVLAGIRVDVPTVLPGALFAVLGVAGGVSLPLTTRNEPLSGPQSAEQPDPGVVASPQPAAPPVTAVTPAPGPPPPPAAG